MREGMREGHARVCAGKACAGACPASYALWVCAIGMRDEGGYEGDPYGSTIKCMTTILE